MSLWNKWHRPTLLGKFATAITQRPKQYSNNLEHHSVFATLVFCWENQVRKVDWAGGLVAFSEAIWPIWLIIWRRYHSNNPGIFGTKVETLWSTSSSSSDKILSRLPFTFTQSAHTTASAHISVFAHTKCLYIRTTRSWNGIITNFYNGSKSRADNLRNGLEELEAFRPSKALGSVFRQWTTACSRACGVPLGVAQRIELLGKQLRDNRKKRKAEFDEEPPVKRNHQWRGKRNHQWRGIYRKLQNCVQVWFHFWGALFLPVHEEGGTSYLY